ncbi:hypothetical protein BDQ17DRAFT_1330508 [Cyathus striatus]|nr:hypothetical protein BDQ17DRAFT_1330508 [Cyathus striatus]
MECCAQVFLQLVLVIFLCFQCCQLYRRAPVWWWHWQVLRSYPMRLVYWVGTVEQNALFFYVGDPVDTDILVPHALGTCVFEWTRFGLVVTFHRMKLVPGARFPGTDNVSSGWKLGASMVAAFAAFFWHRVRSEPRHPVSWVVQLVGGCVVHPLAMVMVWRQEACATLKVPNGDWHMFCYSGVGVNDKSTPDQIILDSLHRVGVFLERSEVLRLQ